MGFCCTNLISGAFGWDSHGGWVQLVVHSGDDKNKTQPIAMNNYEKIVIIVITIATIITIRIITIVIVYIYYNIHTETHLLYLY